MKVLLADTDIGTRTQIESLLAVAGLRISHAVDGRHAWELLSQQSSPMLAILDSEIPPPAMSGLEICRKLRREDTFHYCYIILLSARSYKLAMMVALENGADDFLSKPLNKDEFVARVMIGKRILEREEKLTHITSEWRNMLDRCPMGAVLIDPNGAIRRANKVFYEGLGYERGDLLYKDAGRTIVQNPVHMRHVQEHGRAGSSFEGMEIALTCKNGDVRQLSAAGRSMPLDGGQGTVLFVDLASDQR